MADHPIPWRWRTGDVGLDNALLDARGARVLSTLEGYVFGEGGEDYLRELFRVAPEMEDVLRHVVAYVDQQVRVFEPGLTHSGLVAETERARALLARLDAERKNDV